ncbi:uncharacterized protein V6R79_008765 [Siganus canaliculatus]
MSDTSPAQSDKSPRPLLVPNAQAIFSKSCLNRPVPIHKVSADLDEGILIHKSGFRNTKIAAVVNCSCKMTSSSLGLQKPRDWTGVQGSATAAPWPFFVLMDEVSGQRPFFTPAILIASLPEDAPGPSTAVVVQEKEDDDGEEKEDEDQPGPSRKRTSGDELLK